MSKGRQTTEEPAEGSVGATISFPSELYQILGDIAPAEKSLARVDRPRYGGEIRLLQMAAVRKRGRAVNLWTIPPAPNVRRSWPGCGRKIRDQQWSCAVLFTPGYRYRLHARELPGSPDIVFRSRRKVIFVHGCGQLVRLIPTDEAADIGTTEDDED